MAISIPAYILNDVADDLTSVLGDVNSFAAGLLDNVAGEVTSELRQINSAAGNFIGMIADDLNGAGRNVISLAGNILSTTVGDATSERRSANSAFGNIKSQAQTLINDVPTAIPVMNAAINGIPTVIPVVLNSETSPGGLLGGLKKVRRRVSRQSKVLTQEPDEGHCHMNEYQECLGLAKVVEETCENCLGSE